MKFSDRRVYVLHRMGIGHYRIGKYVIRRVRKFAGKFVWQVTVGGGRTCPAFVTLSAARNWCTGRSA